MVAETCYPVKVSFGHVRELVGKTRFLFLPTLIDMPVPNPSEVATTAPWFRATRTWCDPPSSWTAQAC